MPDITIPAQYEPVRAYAAQGQRIFPFSFPVYSKDSIKVYITPAGSNPNDEKQKLPGMIDEIYYSFTVTINQPPTIGGSVTINTSLNAGDKVVISRDTNLSVVSVFQDGSYLSATSLNQQFNSNTMIEQEISYTANNLCPHYNHTDSNNITAGDQILPRLNPGTVWMKSNDNSKIITASIGAGGGIAALPPINPNTLAMIADISGNVTGTRINVQNGDDLHDIGEINTSVLNTTNALIHNINTPNVNPAPQINSTAAFTNLTAGAVVVNNGLKVIGDTTVNNLTINGALTNNNLKITNLNCTNVTATGGNITTTEDLQGEAVVFLNPIEGQGSVKVSSPPGVAPGGYNLMWPTGQGANGQTFVNNGAGQLGWGAGGAGEVGAVKAFTMLIIQSTADLFTVTPQNPVGILSVDFLYERNNDRRTSITINFKPGTFNNPFYMVNAYVGHSKIFRHVNIIEPTKSQNRLELTIVNFEGKDSLSFVSVPELPTKNTNLFLLKVYIQCM